MVGLAYRETGDHIKALESFRQLREILETQEKTQENDFIVATVIYDEGFEIMKLGRNKEALDIYEELYGN